MRMRLLPARTLHRAHACMCQALYVASDAPNTFLAPSGPARSLLSMHEASMPDGRPSLPVYMVQAATKRVLKRTVKELLPMAVSASGPAAMRTAAGLEDGATLGIHDPSAASGTAGAALPVKALRSPHEWTIDQVRMPHRSLSLPLLTPASACFRS